MKKLFPMMFLLLSFGVSAQSSSANDSDISSLNITMQQDNKTGSIYGTPTYSVTIRGDGTVTYYDTSNVNRIGKKSYTIPIEQVRNLVKEFEAANFFELNSEYVSRDNGNGTHTMIDHGVPLTTSISINGRYKKVYDFMFAPEKLKALERKIYEISLVEQFLKPIDKARPN